MEEHEEKEELSGDGEDKTLDDDEEDDDEEDDDEDEAIVTTISEGESKTEEGVTANETGAGERIVDGVTGQAEEREGEEEEARGISVEKERGGVFDGSGVRG